VRPEWMLLGDSLVLVGIFRSKPAKKSPAVAQVGLRLAALLAASVLASTALDQVVGTTPDEDILDPAEWIGRPFPLMADIDIGANISEGEWILLFHRHDCLECARVVPEFLRRARLTSTARAGRRLALIEVPPFGGSDVLSAEDDGAFVRARLSERKRWALRTPIALHTTRGVVVSVIDRADSVHSR